MANISSSRSKRHIEGLPYQMDRDFAVNANPSIRQALCALFNAFGKKAYLYLEKNATGLSRNDLEALAAGQYAGSLSNPQFMSLAKAARRLAMDGPG